MWPTPITPARFGLVDRNMDLWALNEPIETSLPTAWEIDANLYGDSLTVNLRPVVTRLPHPVDPVAALRGEAAFATAA